MRLTTSLLAAAATAAGLSAQTGPEFEIYPGSTSYTSRHTLAGADEGWVCMNYGARHFRGIAQIDDGNLAGGSVSSVTDMRYVLQDQLGSTQENFEIGIFGEDPNNPGQIDPSVDPNTMRPAPGFEAGPFTTPLGGSAANAWIFTTGTGTPYAGLGMDTDNYFGVLLPANGAWVADGMSIHGAWMTAGGAGDNPSAGALTGGAMGGSVIYDMVQGVNITAGNTVVIAPNDRTARIWYRTDGSVMRVGADISGNTRSTVNPNYGVAALYPDHLTRQDGVAYNMRNLNYDNTLGTQFGVVIMQFVSPMAPAFNTNGFKVVPGAGQQWFDFTGGTGPFVSFVLAANPSDVNAWEQIVVAAGSTPASALGTVTSQGIFVDFLAGDLRPTLTNATAFESL